MANYEMCYAPLSSDKPQPLVNQSKSRPESSSLMFSAQAGARSSEKRLKREASEPWSWPVWPLWRINTRHMVQADANQHMKIFLSARPAAPRA